jgi:hypothetical protein
MSDVIINNPAFSALSDEPGFQSVIEKLQNRSE